MTYLCTACGDVVRKTDSPEGENPAYEHHEGCWLLEKLKEEGHVPEDRVESEAIPIGWEPEDTRAHEKLRSRDMEPHTPYGFY